MDERGANIDIVFRNGLKDYEVLPPPEVWDNIHPVIRRKQRPFIIFRAAAVIAVVLSLSFLAYRWSREVSTGLDNSVMALNMDAANPVYAPPPADKPVYIVPKVNRRIDISSITLTQNIPDNDIITEHENIVSPETAYLREVNVLPGRGVESLQGPLIASLTSSLKKTDMIMSVDPLFLPENSEMKNTERWSISAMASPTYYSKFILGNDVLSKQLMASEQNLLSYSGGVAFSYKINRKFSIQSGIYYSSVGQMLDGINSFGGFQKYNVTKGDHNFEVRTTNGSIFTNNPDVFLISSSPGERILTAYTNDVFDPKKA
ncbi:MAG: hypothetical protein EPN88_11015, partial [Bacteroidetes bacterium]